MPEKNQVWPFSNFTTTNSTLKGTFNVTVSPSLSVSPREQYYFYTLRSWSQFFSPLAQSFSSCKHCDYCSGFIRLRLLRAAHTQAYSNPGCTSNPCLIQNEMQTVCVQLLAKNLGGNKCRLLETKKKHQSACRKYTQNSAFLIKVFVYLLEIYFRNALRLHIQHTHDCKKRYFATSTKKYIADMDRNTRLTFHIIKILFHFARIQIQFEPGRESL